MAGVEQVEVDYEYDPQENLQQGNLEDELLEGDDLIDEGELPDEDDLLEDDEEQDIMEIDITGDQDFQVPQSSKNFYDSYNQLEYVPQTPAENPKDSHELESESSSQAVRN